MNVKFFITPVYPYGNDHYYHEIIAVAEGFKELGYTIFGNANYWWQPETKTYLIEEHNEREDFDIAIYDYRYVTSFAHLLFRQNYPNFDKSKTHILIDRNDWLQPIWWKNPHYTVFDLIFAGNLYETVNYEKNVYPWAIGLTSRIIHTIDKYYEATGNREKITGYNFRVDHNMRGYVLKKLQQNLKKYPATARFTEANSENEIDRFYYKSSVRRHNPEYYKLLCHTQFFMAFGGYYEYKPLLYLPYSNLNKIARKPYYWKYLKLKNDGKDFSDTVFVFQQDNFRFWEVLYSGSIAINLDLSFWNFKLPVMPIADEHYIGIKTLSADTVDDSMERLTQDKIDRMSKNARAWVIEQYSPKAQAQRILDHIKKLKK